jgi:hypothetical protein
MFASLSLVSSRQCSLFDEADQTARTHNTSFKQKLKSYEM